MFNNRKFSMNRTTGVPRESQRRFSTSEPSQNGKALLKTIQHTFIDRSNLNLTTRGTKYMMNIQVIVVVGINVFLAAAYSA